MADDANVFTDRWDFSFEGASAAPVGKRAGSGLLGATVYELQPDATWANLHFHHANEELIIVVDGTPTVRTMDGDRELATGEVVQSLAPSGGRVPTASRTAPRRPPAYLSSRR